MRGEVATGRLIGEMCPVGEVGCQGDRQGGQARKGEEVPIGQWRRKLPEITCSKPAAQARKARRLENRERP